MTYGYSNQIQERINNAAEGTVFVSSDFADIADTETVRRNMNRLHSYRGTGTYLLGESYDSAP